MSTFYWRMYSNFFQIFLILLSCQNIYARNVLLKPVFFSKEKFLDSNDNQVFQTSSKLTLNNLLKDYAELFKNNPACFLPYDADLLFGRINLADTLTEDLCKNEMKEVCRFERENIRKYFLHYDYSNTNPTKKCFVTSLHNEFYQKLRRTINVHENKLVISINKSLENSDNPSQWLEKIQKIFSRTKAIFDRVLKRWITHKKWDQIRNLMIGDNILRLARGNFFDLDAIDLVHSIERQKEKIRQKINENFLGQASIYALPAINKINDPVLFSNDDLFLDSYELDIDSVFFWLKKVGSYDKRLVSLLLQKKYQRAIWLLRDLDYEVDAKAMENFLMHDVFLETNIRYSLPIKEGFSDSFRMDYKNGVSVIFKPRISFWDNPVQSFISHFKREVACHIVDRLLGFNSIPLTFLRSTPLARSGSMQYFVRGAFSAREIRNYTGTESLWLSLPIGRVKKSPEILLFDWLVSNRDRHLENYLYLETGKVVFIDHGITFPSSFKSIKRTRYDLINMIPSEKIFKRMEYMAKNPSLIYLNLKPYLPRPKIRRLLKKIKYFVNFVNLESQNNPDFKFSSHTRHY